VQYRVGRNPITCQVTRFPESLPQPVVADMEVDERHRSLHSPKNCGGLVTEWILFDKLDVAHQAVQGLAESPEIARCVFKSPVRGLKLELEVRFIHGSDLGVVLQWILGARVRTKNVNEIISPVSVFHIDMVTMLNSIVLFRRVMLVVAVAIVFVAAMVFTVPGFIVPVTVVPIAVSDVVIFVVTLVVAIVIVTRFDWPTSGRTTAITPPVARTSSSIVATDIAEARFAVSAVHVIASVPRRDKDSAPVVGTSLPLQASGILVQHGLYGIMVLLAGTAAVTVQVVVFAPAFALRTPELI
jgi:hypothetical protein